MNKDRFFEVLPGNIDLMTADIIRAKNDAKYLTYYEFKGVTERVRGIFRKHCSEVPKQVECACLLSEAVLAPDALEKIHLFRGVIAISGGVAGLAMVLTGIGVALGWGSGVIAAVITFFCGTPWFPVVGWVAGGLGLAALTAYFTFAKGKPEVVSQRAVEALKNGISNAKGIVLELYGAKIEAAAIE